MNQSKFSILLTILSFCVSSCSTWSPDPAEKLANRIESQVRVLEASSLTYTTFTFIPSIDKVKKSPYYKKSVTIRVFPDKNANQESRSTIAVEEWFATTYHNRFVEVREELKMTKQAGEEFQIVLTKDEDKIFWSGIK